MRRGIILFALFLLWRGAGNAESIETVVVHAWAGDGPANLVSNAVPLKPGTLFDARNLRVIDGAVEISVAVKVLAYWPNDNSIRSLLLQFEAPFTTATKAYVVGIGSPRSALDRSLVPVTWDLPTRIFTMPAGYLSDSLFAWEQKPLGQSGYPSWDSKQLTSYASIDIPISPATTCASTDQYYDTISTNYQLYARTGSIRYLVNGRRWALHHRRDQIWLSGSSIGHPKCSSLNNTRYTYPQGLVLDYFMFGDEQAKNVSGLVVDNFYMPLSDSRFYKAPNATGFWTEREPAFALRGILAYYEATNNAAYINEAQRKIGLLHQMQVDNGRRAWVHNLYDHDPEEGCSPADWGSSPWMSGLLIEALIQYHKLTNDPVATDSITMALDDLKARYLATGAFAGQSFVYLGCSIYTNGTPDLDNVISHAFAYGYKLTGNGDYLRVGTDIFNTSVLFGYAGTHKHYNQLFRSSGHFVAYLATDTTPPTVTVNHAPGQPDPTSAPSINFTVAFSEPVSLFSNSDVVLSGTAGATNALVTGTGAIYDLGVSGMTNSGTVTATVPAGVVTDAAANPNTTSTSTDNTVTYNAPDTTPPTVTINQAIGQADPTAITPINFTAVFSEPVSGFTAPDITIGGTAPGTKSVAVAGSGTTYNVAVSGMSSGGTVIATIAAGRANDAAGNPNAASTSSDNTVTYSQALVVTTTSLPSGKRGVPYSAALTSSGGSTPYIWSIASGRLPRGLSLSATTGVISGTPSRKETANFTVRVTGENSLSATKNLSISISR
jgi:hypothetical protein